MNFWTALGLVFIVLKLTGVIYWSWVWVLFPIYAWIVFTIIFFLIVAIVAMFQE